MTQAEKAQLRYIALLTQNQSVQGDMARTITSAANAMRVLKQQFQLLGREIGNIFIPMLMKVIPVAIAVVKVLNKVAKAIAAMFGFQLPDLNWDSINAGAGAVEGLTDDLDDATGSAKKLKRQLAVFDELNNSTSPTAGGSGGIGGVGGAGFELDLPEYDMLAGFNKGIDDLTDKIMKFFGLTEDATGKLSWSFWNMDDKAKALAVTLGVLVGASVLGKFSSLVSSLTGVGAGSLGKFAAILGGIVLSVDGLSRIYKAWNKDIKDTRKNTIGLTKSQRQAGIATAELASAGALLGSRFGLIGSVIGSVVGNVVSLIAALGNFRNILKQVGQDNQQTISAIQKVSLITGTAVGAITNPLFGLIAGWATYKSSIEAVAESTAFGTLELSTQQLADINTAITSSVYDMSGSYQEFVNELESNTTAFKSNFESADTLMYKYLELGETLDEIASSEILLNIEQTCDSAIKLVDDTTNKTIQLLTEQFKHSTSISADEQKEILSTLTSGSKIRTNKIKEIENNIENIYENAIKERGYLNDKELQAIREHYQKIAELTASETEIAELELTRVISQITGKTNSLSKESLEQYVAQVNKSYEAATQVVENSYNSQYNFAKDTGRQIYENMLAEGKSKEEAIKAYNDTVNKLQSDANNQRLAQEQALQNAMKTINQDVLSAVMENYAELSKKTNEELTEVEKAAKQQYENLLKEAGYTTEEITRIAKTGGKNAASGYSDNWQSNMRLKVVVPDASTDAKNAGSRAASNFNSGWKSALQLTLEKTLPTAIRFRTEIESSGNVALRPFSWYAGGGFPASGEFFMARENGLPEMVGRIGNRTAVANNDQIVSGISQGVYNAMINAQAEQQTAGTNVYIGNREVYRSFTNGLRVEDNRLGRTTIRV